MVAFSYIIVFLVYLHTSVNTLAETLECGIKNTFPENINEEVKIGEGILEVNYRSNKIGIYKYADTKSVNVLVNDVEVKFNGTLYKSPDTEPQEFASSITTVVEGVASVTEEDNLSDCNLFLRSNSLYSHRLSVILQDKLFYLAKSCVESTFCNQLGTIQEDYIQRAQNNAYDFGDASVLYTQTGETYPNLQLINKFPGPVALQTSINLIADFFIAGIVHYISGSELGTIQLPNMREVIPGIPKVQLVHDGYIELYGGTFGGLKNIRRSANVNIKNRGLDFSINFGIEVPGANLHFEHYLKYAFVKNQGNTNVNIDSISIGMQIDINYNQSPCQISVDSMNTEIKGIHLDLSCCKTLDKYLGQAIDSIIAKITPRIVGFVKLKVKQAVSAPLSNFNCERFRP